MTFKRFEEIFHSKYPEGEVVAHGKFGGTEKSKKTTVIFEHGGRCYEYYGAYEDVLSRMGMKVISKERLAETEQRLATVKKWHGTDNFFGGVMDCSEEIARLEAFLAEVKAEYIVA